MAMASQIAAGPDLAVAADAKGDGDGRVEERATWSEWRRCEAAGWRRRGLATRWIGVGADPVAEAVPAIGGDLAPAADRSETVGAQSSYGRRRLTAMAHGATRGGRSARRRVVARRFRCAWRSGPTIYQAESAGKGGDRQGRAQEARSVVGWRGCRWRARGGRGRRREVTRRDLAAMETRCSGASDAHVSAEV